jgi:hypothetical protein
MSPDSPAAAPAPLPQGNGKKRSISGRRARRYSSFSCPLCLESRSSSMQGSEGLATGGRSQTAPGRGRGGLRRLHRRLLDQVPVACALPRPHLLQSADHAPATNPPSISGSHLPAWGARWSTTSRGCGTAVRAPLSVQRHPGSFSLPHLGPRSPPQPRGVVLPHVGRRNALRQCGRARGRRLWKGDGGGGRFCGGPAPPSARGGARAVGRW